MKRKPPIGARPGTLSIDPKAASPRVRIFRYDDEAISEHEVRALSEVDRLGAAPDKWWVDVQGLGDESLLRELAELFSIHPLALEDIVHATVRPKAEPYEHNILVVTRMLRTTDDNEIDTEQVAPVIGANYVVTFQEEHGDVLEPVRQRLKAAQSRMRNAAPDYLGYAILDTIVDAYYPVIAELGDRVERLEEQVLVEASPESLRRLHEIKNALIGLRRAVIPQRDTVNFLIRGDSEFVSPEVGIFLRDTYDHVVQTADAIETARELVNGLMNTYLTVVSNRMNEVMKTLTIVASLFVPLTFLAGIYGMNFEHMPELHVKWAYPALLAIMALTGGAMLVYFRRKRWL